MQDLARSGVIFDMQKEQKRSNSMNFRKNREHAEAELFNGGRFSWDR